MHRLFAASLLCGAAALAADQPNAFRDALAALQRGDLASAERILRGEIAAHPEDAPALSTLGVVLDNEKKFIEAAPFHRRALAAAPRIPDVLSNYGNHLAASGDRAGAEAQYRQVLALDPAHVNANLQLARMALEHSGGAGALDYLKQVPGSQLEMVAGNDPRFGFAAAVAFANASQFDRAEALFNRVLVRNPADFNILFNLGVVAASAGHFARARDVLESAIRQQPRNVELLMRLAAVEQAMQHSDSAVRYLAQAARLAPDLAEIQRLLAIAAASLGALDDAIAAWDRYYKLSPGDDSARRERGYLATELGRIEEGTADLEWFLARHRDDALAHYELGVARGDTAHLNRALTLQPGFTAARSARGYLFYQQANFPAALADLELAARERPNDPVILDRLGQTYLSLDRAPDAVRTLRRAAELVPNDSKTQFHLGRALAEAGDGADSRVAMERFRILGPAAKAGVPAGLVDYLSLTPAQQHADYRTRVEKVFHEHPDDPAAKLEHFKLAIEDGGLPEPETAGAAAALTQALPSRPDLYWHTAALLIRTGHAADALALPLPKDDLEAQLIQALVFEILGRPSEATRVLDEIQSLRPEWFALWVARASVLAARHRPQEAARAMETAKSLGARTTAPAPPAALLQSKPPREW